MAAPASPPQRQGPLHMQRLSRAAWMFRLVMGQDRVMSPSFSPGCMIVMTVQPFIISVGS